MATTDVVAVRALVGVMPAGAASSTPLSMGNVSSKAAKMGEFGADLAFIFDFMADDFIAVLFFIVGVFGDFGDGGGVGDFFLADFIADFMAVAFFMAGAGFASAAAFFIVFIGILVGLCRG